MSTPSDGPAQPAEAPMRVYTCTRATLGIFRSALLGALLAQRSSLLLLCLALAVVGVVTPYHLVVVPAVAFPVILALHWFRHATRTLRPLTRPGDTYSAAAGMEALDLVTPVNRVQVPYADLRVLRRGPVAVVVAQRGSGLISVLPAAVVDAPVVDKIVAAQRESATREGGAAL